MVAIGVVRQLGFLYQKKPLTTQTKEPNTAKAAQTNSR